MTERLRNIIDDLLMRKVDEVSYLVARERTHFYRPIVRFFHSRYETSETGWVWPAEVVEFIRAQHPDGAAYDEATCSRDLEQLVKWNVLTSEHDTEQARTIEDVVLQARRYQITEAARIIEDMIIQLSTDGTRGSLDTTRLDRLWAALERLDGLLVRYVAGERSRDLLGDFEGEWNSAEDARAQIRDQANRYLRELDVDRAPGTTEIALFVEYKKLVRQYLDEFVLDLKDFRQRSWDLFQDWEEAGKDELLVAALTQNETERKAIERSVEEVAESFRGHYRALRGFSGPTGTARVLEAKTVARLTTLIQQIERLVLERRNVVNRKRDLELLALAFRTIEDIDTAHAIASAVFGWSSPHHMGVHTSNNADVRAEESAWLQDPCDVELLPQRRGNRQFQQITGVHDRSLQRAQLRARRAEEKLADAAFWRTLFANGDVDFTSLTLPSATARAKVLGLLRNCFRMESGRYQLDDGSTVELLPPSDPETVGEITTPEGVLYIQPFRLRREAAKEAV